MAKIEITAETKLAAVKGIAIPVREGTGRFDRVKAVIMSKRVELALAKGAKMSTVRYCLERGLVKVAA